MAILDLTVVDSAYPSSGMPSDDGNLIYIGGDTPNPDKSPTTEAEYANLKGRFKLPTWVQSVPAAATPANDATAALAWLQAHGVPRGTVTVLDLETAVNAYYVTTYGGVMHAAGYLVWPYGSASTIMQNPHLDGVFVADPTGTPHMYPGAVATQYAWNQSYDVSLIAVASTSELWDTAAPSGNITVAGVTVPDVQTRLNVHGASPTLVVDGVWGPLTQTATVDFQSKSALPANGIVDQPTWTALSANPNTAPKEIDMLIYSTTKGVYYTFSGGYLSYIPNVPVLNAIKAAGVSEVSASAEMDAYIATLPDATSNLWFRQEMVPSGEGFGRVVEACNTSMAQQSVTLAKAVVTAINGDTAALEAMMQAADEAAIKATPANLTDLPPDTSAAEAEQIAILQADEATDQAKITQIEGTLGQVGKDLSGGSTPSTPSTGGTTPSA